MFTSSRCFLLLQHWLVYLLFEVSSYTLAYACRLFQLLSKYEYKYQMWFTLKSRHNQAVKKGVQVDNWNWASRPVVYMKFYFL